MPDLCFCKTHGCGERNGVERHRSTIRSHGLDDRRADARQLRFEDHQHIEAQHDHISSFISAATLANNVSEPTVDGGRLWSQQYASSTSFQTMQDFFQPQEQSGYEIPDLPPPPPPSMSPPQNSSNRPSNREQESIALDAYTKFQDRIISLRKKILHDLRPGETVDALTVSTHKRSLRSLRRDLETVPYRRHKADRVRAMREGIDIDLDDLEEALKTADTAPTPPTNSIPVDTRKSYSADCLRFELIGYTFRASLRCSSQGREPLSASHRVHGRGVQHRTTPSATRMQLRSSDDSLRRRAHTQAFRRSCGLQTICQGSSLSIRLSSRRTSSRGSHASGHEV